MRELKATDKITQKMTRDGAVSENLATGEVKHISLSLIHISEPTRH